MGGLKEYIENFILLAFIMSLFLAGFNTVYDWVYPTDTHLYKELTLVFISFSIKFFYSCFTLAGTLFYIHFFIPKNVDENSKS